MVDSVNVVVVSVLAVVPDVVDVVVAAEMEEASGSGGGGGTVTSLLRVEGRMVAILSVAEAVVVPFSLLAKLLLLTLSS